MTKTVSQSRCMMTEIVLPNDTNGLGNLMGGRLLYLMDKCAAISAMRHAGRICVTAAVDSVEFQAPIRQSEVVVVESQVNRTFRTSLEVGLVVWAEDLRTQARRKCNTAFYTFVAIDEAGRPSPISPVHPETPQEMYRYQQAAMRRELRLFLAGRLKLEDAPHIREDILSVVAAEQEEPYPPKTS